MSKKKLKKFKKKHSQINPTVDSTQVSLNTTSSQITELEEKEIISEIKEIKNRDNELHDDIYMTDKYEHVRKDVKKILLIMSSIIIVLIATYFLNQKTTYLTSLGNWIYKILNIQVQ